MDAGPAISKDSRHSDTGIPPFRHNRWPPQLSFLNRLEEFAEILDALAHGRFVVVIEVLEDGSPYRHLCGACLFPADHLPFIASKGWVGVSEGPTLAGREFFLSGF